VLCVLLEVLCSQEIRVRIGASISRETKGFFSDIYFPYESGHRLCFQFSLMELTCIRMAIAISG
jgi:hypothetical protein